MFIEERSSSTYPTIVLIGCKVCHIGDMLPKHPTWTIPDLYHFVYDDWRIRKEIEDGAQTELKFPPIFRYDTMTEKALKYLQKNITLGSIEVKEIVEERKEEEKEEEESERSVTVPIMVSAASSEANQESTKESTEK